MTVHFIMQGKGGVGKSLVASILIQYLRKQGHAVSGCDTDPVNSSLAQYKNLEVQVIDIMDGDDIDPGRFDQLISHIDDGPADEHLVVDIGASCFVALCAYLKKYEAFEVLKSLGHEIYIHTVITGGVNLLETVNNLQALACNFEIPIIVWLNPFFGDIEKDRGFEDFKIYQEIEKSLAGIIRMPKLGNSLFERDFEALQARHETFEEAHKNSNVHLMSRSRLFRIWNNYQQAIGQVGLFEGSSS